MSQKYLEYSLVEGFIHNWLVAGPHGYQEGQGLPTMPIHPIERDLLQINEKEYRWKYSRCQEDHLTHLATSTQDRQLLKAWAYSLLKIPGQVNVVLVVETSSSVTIWLNDEQILNQPDPGAQGGQHRLPITLAETGKILVELSGSAKGASALNFSMRVTEPGSEELFKEIKVLVPTNARFPHRYQALEKLLENAYLEDIVHYRGDHFNLRWNEEIRDESFVAFAVQDADERIYVDGKYPVDPENPQDVGHTYRLFERAYRVALSAPGREYWEQNLRYTRFIPIHILDAAYSKQPYGSPFSRRQEALQSAAKFENIFGVLAKIETGRLDDCKVEVVQAAIDGTRTQAMGSEADLLGLFMLLQYHLGHPVFPESLWDSLKSCLVEYTYDPLLNSPEEPDSKILLRWVVEILAGQKYPDETFTQTGNPGAWHRQRAEKQAQAWLIQKGQYGFTRWNAHQDWPEIFLALAQLSSLADTQEIAELAAVVLDKMLFLMAVNSFKGSFGASHGHSIANVLKSSQLEATSGVSRMLWGVGVFNQHIAGTVGLACSEYEYPAFFHTLATQIPDSFLHQEKIMDPASPEIEAVHLVTYKTPDFQLSSTLDYKPGQPDGQEHLWQATLGPETIIFTNHPACSSEDPAYAPGFWLGNASRPRLAQHNDLLIAIYNLPENDRMGFTHAYFPIPSCDDFYFREGWSFLRKGDGYLALKAAQGTQFLRQGPSAYRELRSYGHQNTWIVQMGSQKIDGTFAGFGEKVTAMELSWLAQGVQVHTLRNDNLRFEWQGPLLVNGQPKSLHNPHHIENPYCIVELPAAEMEITNGDLAMRLKFI
jgi:hypothetical protein